MKAKKSRSIVFINQATGYLTIDIINSFAANFENVALIAGSIRIQDIDLDKKVQWTKIVKYDRGNPLRKFISWIVGTIQIFFLLAFKYRKYEVFYITIPPSAYLLSLLLPNKFSILVFDVYPDVLKIYNIKESSFLYNLWMKWNRQLFKKAHRVFTIGEGMALLLAAYMPKEEIRIIPLWTGLTKIVPTLKQSNPWLKNLGLESEFIIQYSGNIGYTHNVEIIVDLAHMMKDEAGIHFLIIGRGERVNHIRDLLKNKKLSNCTLLPFQDDNVLNYSLAAADLGVALLDEKTAHVSLPSKIYNLQAVAVPIIGISPLDSELNKHLTYYGNGKCFQQSDTDGIIQFIHYMKEHPEEHLKMSMKSKEASKFHSSENAFKYYEAYVS